MDNTIFADFAIEEIESTEALSESSDWFLIGLGIGVYIGILAC